MKTTLHPLPRFIRIFCLGLSLIAPGLSAAQAAGAPVTVTLDPANAAAAPVSPDFIGLSFETQRIEPEDGKYYFSPDNAPLIAMFKTLGIKSLRIGGNTVDNLKVPIPGQADIDNLFGFAQAAGVKVIYSFRLRQGDAASEAAQAKYIYDKYAASLECFSIGNEPDVFIGSTEKYFRDWEPLFTAISTAVPDAKFCGPSLTSNHDENWSVKMAAIYGPTGKIDFICQHQYSGGAGGAVKDPVVGRDTLLSAAWIQEKYQKYYDLAVPPLADSHLPYRMEEANNFYNGGAKDVSDSFAAALWGLDYLHFWASHQTIGVNFHNGDQVAAGQNSAPCRYASFTSADDGYLAHPIAYGIKLFDLGAHGRSVPVTVASADPAVNLTAYAFLGDDRALYVTLINKEHDAGARDAEVALNLGAAAAAYAAAYNSAQEIDLQAPNNDVSVKEGMTLGGAPIQNSGTWQGAWHAVPAASGEAKADGVFHVTVPAASAILIKLGAPALPAVAGG